MIRPVCVLIHKYGSLSCINKLSISGVRSFSPLEKEVIEFGQPLTLIVGQNGTGKTTIIECLKYATTGDLPPNSKGGAFVHDPKIDENKEVKAQIKLGFKNNGGNQMVVTRSMQLLIKRTTSTFKTLEGQLVIMNQNEKTRISTKVSELDVQVPNYLGVSKAILEYVIFCHQEDSLWPLSEPSILKKRFDEIFEALKFTRALDNIKNIRKGLVNEIKLLEQSVQHLQSDKDKATKAESKKEELQSQIDDFKQEVEKLSEDIDDINSKIARLFKSNQEFQAVVAKLDNLEFSRQSYNNQIKRLEDHIEFLHDSDEILVERSSNFQKEIQKYESEIQRTEKENSKVFKQLDQARESYGDTIREEGELKGLEKIYEKNIKSRNELIQKNVKMVDIPPTDNITDDVVKKFSRTIEKLKKMKDHEVEECTYDYENKVKEFEKKIQKITNSISNEVNLKKYNSEDIEKIEEENHGITKKINNIQFDEASTEYEKTLLENMEAKLKKLKTDNSVESVVSKIKENESTLSKLEAEIDDINKQLTLSSKRADIYAKISLMKEDQKYKEKALESLLKKHGESFQKICGADLEVRSCNKLLSETLEAQEGTLKDLNKKKELIDKNFNEVESTLKYKTDSLASKKAKLISSERIVKQKLPEDVNISEYEEYLKDLEVEYKELMEDIGIAKSSKDLNVKAIDVAKTKHFCMMCARNFTVDELKSFVERVTGMISKLEDGNDSELIKLEQEISQARAISNDVVNYRDLNVEIPKLENELRDLRTQLESITKERETTNNDVQSNRKILLEMESLQQPMNDITRMSKDLENVKLQLNAKKQELNEFGNLGNEELSMMGNDELQALQFNKNSEFKKYRLMNKNLTEEKELSLKEMNNIENQIKDKRLFIINLEKSLIEKENLTKTLDSNNRKVKELENTIKKIGERLSELESFEVTTRGEYDSFKAKAMELLERLNVELAELTNVFDQLGNFNSAISKYAGEDKSRLEKVQKKVQEIDLEVSKLEASINEKNSIISDLRDKIANQDRVEKNIQDNLQLRDLNSKLSTLEIEIEELKDQNAEAKKQEYETKSKELQKQLAKIQSQYGGKLGEIRQMENQVQSIARELKEDYEGISESYHKEWVTLQTKTLIDDDLMKYGKALDSGIMKYHSMKMEEINKLIDELWHETYRGTDVDTIQIRSDVNLQSKGNRSYNYRVIMKKGEVELDMRGRCSAGQKVLASIIIRLALAECFGINCGMIALDEPTTNLDVENSEGLAQSLSRIIEMRQRQKNFQLIVITHDEKFLNHMNASKYTDHFFRVVRNEQQTSQIERVDITRIAEE
ncbi:MRX complex DNA-binding subunit [Saccharomycopsis crataegensis]|uniref:DNA repair protein RAD50 n=1 Tax=Saccharomycopsis crataegensis TaxID=43959 RepID=A0AAV5QV41_9ASCO|nr:MRX complex DNA-binding subunit [Saccharomycopsis crataegensis]